MYRKDAFHSLGFGNFKKPQKVNVPSHALQASSLLSESFFRFCFSGGECFTHPLQTPRKNHLMSADLSSDNRGRRVSGSGPSPGPLGRVPVRPGAQPVGSGAGVPRVPISARVAPALAFRRRVAWQCAPWRGHSPRSSPEPARARTAVARGAPSHSLHANPGKPELSTHAAPTDPPPNPAAHPS